MIYQELKNGIREGINFETFTSETYISSVVTHELTMLYNYHYNPNDRENLAENASYFAMFGVEESTVPFHTFAISEAMRGIIHGLASVGMDVSDIARHALRGARKATQELGVDPVESEKALRQGVRYALDDLGMNHLEDDPALELPGLYKEESALMGADLL